MAGARWAIIAATVGAALCWTAPAGAATQFGQTFNPTSTGPILPATTYLQCLSPGDGYGAPSPGVITSWSFQADGLPPQIKLKVGRLAASLSFTIVGESALETPAPSELNTFSTRIPVQAGDLLGFFATPGTRNVATTPAPGYNTCRRVGDGDQPVGTTNNYSQQTSPEYQLDVAAILEPDADNDGFGDETQDQCPGDASKQGDCAPPDTQITKGPKDKTRKKRALFEFSSGEQSSTFQCSLDGGAFAACSSPHTVKVKKGKHTFSVRATDTAANVDGSPASDEWKVKKKRK